MQRFASVQPMFINRYIAKKHNLQEGLSWTRNE